MLSIRIKKISPTHHEFAYERGDGTGEVLELETKSFLFHDLLHFAVESEAELKHSFYGLLYERGSYAELSGAMDAQSHSTNEVVMTERVVGALTGVIKSNVPVEQFISAMHNMLDAYAEPMPPWLTEAFVTNVEERMRQLLGQWNATPFGETMELHYDV
jgi:hypothetical protein